jgi:hypothetical protein
MTLLDNAVAAYMDARLKVQNKHQARITKWCERVLGKAPSYGGWVAGDAHDWHTFRGRYDFEIDGIRLMAWVDHYRMDIYCVCSECNSAANPIHSLEDLGKALIRGEPKCSNCKMVGRVLRC